MPYAIDIYISYIYVCVGVLYIICIYIQAPRISQMAYFPMEKNTF